MAEVIYTEGNGVLQTYLACVCNDQVASRPIQSIAYALLYPFGHSPPSAKYQLDQTAGLTNIQWGPRWSQIVVDDNPTIDLFAHTVYATWDGMHPIVGLRAGLRNLIDCIVQSLCAALHSVSVYMGVIIEVGLSVGHV